MPAPANLSRWHNVKQIFANLLEVNDVESAVADVSAKLDILAAHQQELERARGETVINLITLFGIVSILASVLSIVQILSDGNMLIWASTILTTGLLALATAFALRRRGAKTRKAGQAPRTSQPRSWEIICFTGNA